MNRGFDLIIGGFISKFQKKIILSNSYFTQTGNNMIKAIKEWMEVIEKEEGEEFRISEDYKHFNSFINNGKFEQYDFSSDGKLFK